MSPELGAALAGAGVAFVGTYLLQRAQFRRADRERRQELRGLVRQLRADLHVSKKLCEGALASRRIMAGVECRTETWTAQGHKIIAVLMLDDEVEALVEAFGRMAAVNGVWRANPDMLVLTEQEVGAGALPEGRPHRTQLESNG
jgi:hypothetical protein